MDETHSPFNKWFPDGRLNITAAALDHHVAHGRGDTPALIYDSPVTHTKQTITYKELAHDVARTAGMLARHGVGLHDRVVIYMPMIPTAVVAMLAVARLGAIHVGTLLT